MRILVAGAGGLGGYYGGRLQLSGQDVAFLARGRTLEALRANGLAVRATVGGDFHLDHVHAASDAGELGVADAVLFLVKTYDNSSAADAVEGAVGEGTAICSLQNGVDNEGFLRERFPQAVVLGGTSRIEAFVESPGVVVQRDRMADVTIGAFRLEDRPMAARLGTAFDSAGIPVTLASDIGAALWQKLVIICGVGAITAYAAAPMGEIMADERLRDLLRALLGETATVAAARGVDLPAAMPDAVFAYASSQLDAGFLSSMARDRLAGRPMEVEALNGAVVRYGEEAGVPTPANRTVADELLPLHREAMGRRATAAP
jgi:2-dehydropantoate 2-reductase